MKNKKILKKKKVSTFDIINYTLFGLFAFICLYPLWYVLIGSFNEGMDYISGGVYLLPRKFTLDNYRLVFGDVKLWRAFFITVSRTVLGTTISVLFTSAVAYAMSRRETPFRRFFYWANIFTMFFGGGLVPFFLVIKMLGLYDTYWLYLIPCAYSVYHMIVISSYFRSIPEELHEAAVMDGASEFYIFSRIMMRLATPVIATVSLWVAMGHWNSYFDTMVYTRDEKLWTLQYYLMRLINTSSVNADGITLPPSVLENITAESVTYAAIIVSVLPILFVFPFVSKCFDKGIMLGSLKG